MNVAELLEAYDAVVLVSKKVVTGQDFLLNDNRPSASMEHQRFLGLIVSSLGLSPVQGPSFIFLGKILSQCR